MSPRLAARLRRENESGVYLVAGPRLSHEQLRRFAVPLTWREIVRAPGERFADEEWWRAAVMEADECGRGLLEWQKGNRTWRLSALGREVLGLSTGEVTHEDNHREQPSGGGGRRGAELPRDLHPGRRSGGG